MKRVPEPELMADPEQALAYSRADFEEPHSHFITLLIETIGHDIPESGCAVDLGCGAADISIRFARAFPDFQIDAIDGSPAMLAEGRKAVASADLVNRINLIQATLQEFSLANQDYSVILCNSLLHHLHNPTVLWELIKTATSNPAIFIMDLMRPGTDDQVGFLVEQYADTEPPVLKRDFKNSLRAAFTPVEVISQLRAAGLTGLRVDVVSDRHLVISS